MCLLWIKNSPKCQLLEPKKKIKKKNNKKKPRKAALNSSSGLFLERNSAFGVSWSYSAEFSCILVIFPMNLSMMPFIGFLGRPEITSWFYEHHLCALKCVKLPVLLLPWEAWVSPNLMYRATQRLVRWGELGRARAGLALLTFQLNFPLCSRDEVWERFL